MKKCILQGRGREGKNGGKKKKKKKGRGNGGERSVGEQTSLPGDEG